MVQNNTIILSGNSSLITPNNTFTNSVNPSLTFFLTVLAGLTVLIIGQVIIKFILEPIQEQKKIISKISSLLSYYANIYTQPGYAKPKIEWEASQDIRHISTQLKAITDSIPKYNVFQNLNLVKPKNDIFKACDDLMGISNNFGKNANADKNTEWSSEIKELLDI
ncbi:MAG: hypothetical protein PHD33_07155 [Atribacterota bacterium]|nr:hypothetical protein [Atribacterota bacterium]